MLANLINLFDSVFGLIILFIVGFIVASILISRRNHHIIKVEMTSGGEEYGERASTRIMQFSTMTFILSIVASVALVGGILWYAFSI